MRNLAVIFRWAVAMASGRRMKRCVRIVIVLTIALIAMQLNSDGRAGGSMSPTLLAVPQGNGYNVDLSVAAGNVYICPWGWSLCPGPNEGRLRIVEHATNVHTGDRDGNGIEDGIAAYQFSVSYDPALIVSVNPADIVFSPGGVAAPRGQPSCLSSAVTEAHITFGCATSGAGAQGFIGDMDIASLDLIPDLNFINGRRPNQDTNNRVLTTITENSCQIADVFGDDVVGSSGGLLPGCGGAQVTVRMLEADLSLDCRVDVTDEQSMAYRYGRHVLNSETWYDLRPYNAEDGYITMQDMQVVFGRDSSTCQHPIPGIGQAPMSYAPNFNDDGLTIYTGPVPAEIQQATGQSTWPGVYVWMLQQEVLAGVAGQADYGSIVVVKGRDGAPDSIQVVPPDVRFPPIAGADTTPPPTDTRPPPTETATP